MPLPKCEVVKFACCELYVHGFAFNIVSVRSIQVREVNSTSSCMSGHLRCFQLGAAFTPSVVGLAVDRCTQVCGQVLGRKGEAVRQGPCTVVVQSSQP